MSLVFNQKAREMVILITMGRLGTYYRSEYENSHGAVDLGYLTYMHLVSKVTQKQSEITEIYASGKSGTIRGYLAVELIGYG